MSRRGALRKLAVLLGSAFALVLLFAGIALAYWSSTDSSNEADARAVAGSVGAGQAPTFTVSGRNVTLSWGAATNATSYTVARSNVSPQSLSTTLTGSCLGTVSGLTCTDVGLPENGNAATNWTYTDTGHIGSWIGPESPASAQVTIPAPSLSLTTSTFTTAGGTTDATVASFFDNEGVTYCIDLVTTSCPSGQVLGTDTVPASGGTVTTIGVTIPAGLTVGSHTVYAIGSLVSLPSAPITVNPGPAHKFAVAGSATQVAGTSNDLTITAQDFFGNTADTFTGSHDLVFSGANDSPSGSSPTVTDSTGTDVAFGTATPITFASGVATVDAGDNGAMTLYKAEVAAIVATEGALTTPTPLSVTVSAAAPAKISVSSGSPQSTTVNSPFGAELVALVQDEFDNPVPGAEVTVEAPDEGASASVATSPATTGVDGLASASATANTTAGAYVVQASVDGVTETADFALTNDPDVTSQLVFTTDPRSATAGVSTDTITIQRRDQFGNPNTAEGDLLVGLSSDSTTGEFRDVGDAGPVTEVTILEGSSTASFLYRDTTAGSFTLTVAEGTPLEEAQGVTITPDVTSQLVFTTDPRSATAGVSTDTITIQRRDQFGNPNTAEGDLLVGLSSDSTTGEFRDVGDAGPVTEVTILEGSSTASFLYRDTTAGSFTLTVAEGTPLEETQGVTITPDVTSQLVFTTDPRSATAGVSTDTITIQRRDQFGNPNTAEGDLLVGLSSDSTTGEFRDVGDAGPVTEVTILEGSSTASFLYRDTTAGSFTLTVAEGTPLEEAQGVTITPDVTSQLVFTTDPRSATAGVSTDTITIQRRDQFGNPNTAEGDLLVGLSSDSTTGEFRDVGDAGPVTEVTILEGSSTASFLYRDTTAGSFTLTVAEGTPLEETQGVTITPDVTSQLVFTTPPQSTPAGTPSGTITIQRRDQFENLTTTGAITVTLAGSSATETFRDDTTPTTVIPSVQISDGSSTASFRYHDTTPGSFTITATSGAVTGTQGVTVTVPATKLVFTTIPANNVVAGVATGTITVQRQSAANAAITTDPAITVDLTSTSPGGGFRDLDGTTVITSVQIPNGQSSASFRYRDTRAGTATITAAKNGGGLTSATLSRTTVAAAAAKIAWTQAPFTVTAGQVSSAIRVQRQDEFGNPQTGPAISGALTTTSANAQFLIFSALPITEWSIGNGQTTSAIDGQYRDFIAGTPTITAVGSPGLASATQVVTVNPAPATKLVFTSAPQVTVVNVATGVMTVQRQDGSNNPNSTDAAITVNLTSSSGTGTFRDADNTANITSVQISVGQSSASFRYQDTTVGNPTLTAAKSGGSPALTPATQQVTISGGPATQLAITTPARTAGQNLSTDLITVQRRDVDGNATSIEDAITIGLASDSPTGTFRDSADGATITSVTIPSGQSSASFRYRDSTPGTPTVTVSSTGLTSASQTQTILGVATHLVITTPPRTATASTSNSAATDLITVERRDANGLPTSWQGTITVNLASNSLGTFAFRNAGNTGGNITSVQIASGQSSASFRYRDNRAGTPLITASSTGLTSASQNVTITAAAATGISAFSGAGQEAIVGTNFDFPLVAQVTDQFNNPVSGVSVTFSAPTNPSLASASLDPTTPVVTGPNGRAQVSAAANLIAGSYNVTATASVGSAPFLLTNLGGPATQLVFTTAPQSATAGTSTGIITIERRDLYMNPSTLDPDVEIALTSDSPSGQFFDELNTTPISSVTIPAGSSAASFRYRDTTVGTHTIEADGSAAGLISAQQHVTINPPATKLVILAPPQTTTAGASTGLITVERRDASDNPVTSDPTIAVSLTSTSGTGVFRNAGDTNPSITSVQIPVGSSSATFRYRDNTAGTPTITASSGALDPGTQVVTVNPAAASKLVFTTPPRTTPAGTPSGTITVQRQDSFNNPTTTGTITVTPAGSSLTETFRDDATPATVIPNVQITAGSSTASFRYFDNTAGSFTITASSAGLTTTPAQAVTVTPGAATQLVFTVQPTNTAPNAAITPAVVVAVRDTFGNTVTTDNTTSVTVALGNPGGSTLSGTNPVTAVNGLATFTNLSVNNAGTGYTLTASAAGLTGATSNTFSVINPLVITNINFADPGGSSNIRTWFQGSGSNSTNQIIVTVFTDSNCMNEATTGGLFGRDPTANTTSTSAGVPWTAGSATSSTNSAVLDDEANFWARATQTGTPASACVPFTTPNNT